MHLVWLTIDGLQPAYLGPYGCEWIETPAFDRLAARGVVFDWHFAESPNTPAEIPALPCPVGRDLRSARKLAREPAAVLRLDWPAPIAAGPRTEIDPDDDERFAQLQADYAAGIAAVDEKLAALADDLESRGWGEALWVVTSPRGYPLGEHGVVGFPGPLHEELVHVPLLIAWPGGDHAGRRIAHLTAVGDLPAALERLLTGPPGLGPDCLRSRERIVVTDGGGRGFRTRDWYLLHDSAGARLFVKPGDRWEVNDVAAQHEEIVAELSR